MTEPGQRFQQLLEDRHMKGKQLIEQGHFPECYMVAYPDDPDVYCTCLSNGCPDD